MMSKYDTFKYDPSKLADTVKSNKPANGNTNGGKRSFINNKNDNNSKQQQPRRQTQRRNNDNSDNIAIANKFINDITEYRNDIRNIRLIIAENIEQISMIIFSGESDINMADTINKLIAILTTGQIPNTLSDMITNERIDIRNDTLVSNISFTISKVLQGSASLNLSDDKIESLVSAFEELNKDLISEIVTTCSVPKELALDLMISYPIPPSMMTKSSYVIKNYDKFITRILDYSDDIKTSVTSDMISELFRLLFGSDYYEGGNMACVKIIGSYLSHPPINIDPDDDVKNAIYGEFVKSIYSTLNEYADKSISVALRMVRNAIQNGINVLFNIDDAKLFANIIAIWNK